MFSVLIRPFVLIYRVFMPSPEGISEIPATRDRGLKLGWIRGNNGRPTGSWRSR
jgi:hypothetical protein